ncbi:MAG: transcription antitermination factor NusB [Phycisphaerae bacterium]
MDKRTRARELTIQALYQLDVQGPELLNFIGQFFLENEPDDLVRKIAADWTKGAWQNVERCDELISKASIKWSLSRISPVDKSILRMSVYHLTCCDDIPPKVVINEAVELAKKFSTAQSPAFVNGVLDAVMKKLNKPQINTEKE